MGIMYKVMNFLGLADEQPRKKEEYVEQEDGANEEWTEEYETALTEQHSSELQSSAHKVVSLQAVKQSAKMILMEPNTYEEAQEIADHLKNRRPVIINLHRLPHDEGMRVIDFLSGTVYAIGGEIQKIGNDTFLCTPDHIHIQGSITESMSEEFQSRMR